MTPSRPSLFFSRRFLPLFITQFTGAFNDNFYKSALLVMFTYGSLQTWGLSVDVINNLVAATLIIPFLLFAGAAGQLADKREKSGMVRAIKIAEVLIMLAGAVAVLLQSSLGLLLVLFATGTQSACFSPLKYSIVPQHFDELALTKANGFMHLGTNLALFGGLMIGAALISLPTGAYWVAGGGVALALVGWLASRQIPSALSAAPDLIIDRNPLRHIVTTLAVAKRNPVAFTAVLGVSWYWFLGSIYLTQLPNLTRSVLAGGPMVVSLLLFLFLFGICIGAVSCARLSRQRVEPAVILVGAIGIMMCGLDMAWTTQQLSQVTVELANADYLTIPAFVSNSIYWRFMLDVALVGYFGGLYFVPLLGLMQSRVADSERARVLAANNIVNAFAMILAAVVAVLVLGVLRASIPVLFVVVAVLHGVMMFILIKRLPEIWQRFVTRFVPVAKRRQEDV